MSKRVLKENQVFIAANTILESGNILAPTNIEKSVPSNVLHVHLPIIGFDVLGLHVPDYGNKFKTKQKNWDYEDRSGE